MEFNGNELTHNYQKLQSELLNTARLVSRYHSVPIIDLNIWHYIQYFRKEYGLLLARNNIPASLKEMAGQIIKTDGMTIIATNEILDEVAEAMVLGHELGHYVEHIDDSSARQSFAGLVDNNGYYSHQYIHEFEANQMALMLLINDWALLNALSNRRPVYSITQH